MADEVAAGVCSSNTALTSNSKLEYNKTRLISVEFPGLVQNPSHMIECLGGEEELGKVFCNQTRRLPMTFRPQDPYSKVMCGDRQPSTSLLLRVRRRKKKSTASEEEGKHEYQQEVLGVVDTTYRFNSLSDYQYLTKDSVYPLSQVHGLDMLENDVPRNLFPPVFSRFEKPINYLFQPDIQPPQAKETIDVDDEEERKKAAKMRKRPKVYALAVSHQTKEIPQKPHEKTAEALALIQDNQLEVIQKLFNIRPIWSRMALHAHTTVSHHRLKQLLSFVAYYCMNGPWRCLWVKIGYDPRKDPNAKIYQLIEFRIGARSVGRNIPIQKKRHHNHYNLPFLRKSQTTAERWTVNLRQTEEKEDTKDDDLPYVFSSNKLPVQTHVFYQLCDLHIAEVQEIITANDGQEEECHEKEGWVVPGSLDKIRDILVKHTLSFVENIKKDQQSSEKDSDIQWEQHEEVKSFLEMLEGDDDVETYDVFGNDSDDDDDVITTQIE